MRLLLTRPLEQTEEVRAKLTKAGHEVLSLPLLEILPPADGGKALTTALQNIAQYQWLILTSQNAVAAVAKRIKKLPDQLHVVCVGPKTLEAAKPLGKRLIAPSDFKGGANLVRYFSEINMKGERVLFPRSSIGREDLAEFLRKARGAVVDCITAYQTVPAKVLTEEIQSILQKDIDAILFFSPSAVEAFFSKIEPDDSCLRGVSCTAIGPTTAEALEHYGVTAVKAFPE